MFFATKVINNLRENLKPSLCRDHHDEIGKVWSSNKWEELSILNEVGHNGGSVGNRGQVVTKVVLS